MDLFEAAECYPASPGWKARDTAKDAAAKAAPTSSILRAQCLRLLSDGIPRTADQCAELLGKDRLAIRPRLSELAATGDVVDSGIRRENMSGRSAICWRVAD